MRGVRGVAHWERSGPLQGRSHGCGHYALLRDVCLVGAAAQSSKDEGDVLCRKAAGEGAEQKPNLALCILASLHQAPCIHFTSYQEASTLLCTRCPDRADI